jgi:hypothetical protein
LQTLRVTPQVALFYTQSLTVVRVLNVVFMLVALGDFDDRMLYILKALELIKMKRSKLVVSQLKEAENLNV